MPTKKVFIKKAKKLCLLSVYYMFTIGQIEIESHSFLNYWETSKIYVQFEKIVFSSTF